MPSHPLLILAGAVCLAVGTVLMRMQIPREDRPPPTWMQTDAGSTTMALGTFILLIFGVALLFKGF